MKQLAGILSLSVIAIQLLGQTYQPSWSSLRNHHTPEWMEDAKSGIYCHWGLTTVKQLDGNGNKHLRELIPLFNAEKFDPAEWAQLFKDAGAQFAGPVAWHGSGYLHWDSDLTRWNSMDMSPGIDIVGSLKPEIKKREMKFLTSYHGPHNYAFPHWGMPEYRNPEYAGLYGPVHDIDATNVVRKNRYEKQSKMSEEFMGSWLAKMQEAIGRYQPDIVWVDVTFGGTLRAKNKGSYVNGRLENERDIFLDGIRQKYQKELLATYFNMAEKWGKEVEFVYKVHDIPPRIGMRDIENGLLNDLAYDPWMPGN